MAKALKPATEAAGSMRHSGPVALKEVRRILVIRPGGLGDAALTVPMLQALRQGFPEAGIDVLVERRNAGVYEISDVVDEIYRYDSGALSVLRRLRNVQYDLVIDTEQFHHFSTVFANLLRPKFLCGFNTLGRSHLQTHSVPYSDDAYEVYSFLRLAESVLGSSINFDPDRPFIDVMPEAQAWAAQAMEAKDARAAAVIAPVAGGSSRLWPVARYAEVAEWLIGCGHYVVLLAGRDGIEAASKISHHCRPGAVLNLAGETTLAQSAAVLQQAGLSVSADTGVMHLAYGVGTPTVALFGSGSHLKWGPPGRDHRIVRNGLSCSPCIRFGRLPSCPHDFACMRELHAGDVIAAIEDLLPG